MIRPLLAVLTVITAFGFVAPMKAEEYRSRAALRAFENTHICPSTNRVSGPGRRHNPCPGYVIDHIDPLECGGPDTPANMQWQTIAEGKAKDRWEGSPCGRTGP